MASTGRETLDDTLRSAQDACRRGLIMAVVVAILATLLSLAMPIFILHVSERVVAAYDTAALAILMACAMLAIGCQAALDYWKAVILARLGYWLEARLSLAFLEAAIQRATRTQAVAARGPMRSAELMRRFIADGQLAGAIDLACTPLLLVFLYFAHYTFALIAIIGIVAQCQASVWAESVRRPTDDAARQLGDDAERLADSGVAGANALGTNGMNAALLDLWATLQGSALDMRARLRERAALVAAGLRLFRLAIQVGAVGVGAMLVVDQVASIGVVIAGSLVLHESIRRFERAGAIWVAVDAVRDALAQLRRFAAQSQPARTPALAPPAELPVVIDDITFRHPGNARDLFRHLELEVEPGDIVSIAGAAGSGKSTLARLLCGVALPTSGCVLIGGTETRHLSHDAIGEQIGYLPQETILCPGTVAENISRFSKAHPARVREAARLAGADELLADLPDGYDAHVDGRTPSLSPRLLRRLALARALFGDPELLILDEPDPPMSDQDLEAWSLLVQRLRQRRATVVIFTQSSDLMALADRVMHISGTRLEAEAARFSRPLRSTDARTTIDVSLLEPETSLP